MDSNNNESEYLSIDECLKTANKAIDNFLKTNEFYAGMKEIEPYVKRSPYHSMFNAMAYMAFAGISLDKADIDVAEKKVEEFEKMCNKLRRNGFIENIKKMVKTPNYQKFTDMEAHSELLYSISIGLRSGIVALNNQNIYGLVKVAFNARKFLKVFGTIKNINYNKTVWESQESQQTFESAMRLMNGCCHLAISRVPPKLLKIVNFFGVRGVESIGFANINKCAFELTGMFSKLARGGLLVNWTYVEAHESLKLENLELCEIILKKELEQYPESLIYKGFVAKIQQITGNIDNAIDLCHQIMEATEKPIHYAIFCELICCYALKCEWTECIRLSQILREETPHSPACANFAEAIFRYTKSVDDNDPDMKQKATELFRVVPSLRIRHLGKTITPEKIAVVYSEKYMKFNETLILPEMEFLYQGNLISFIKNDKILLNKHLERIEKLRQKYEYEIHESDYLDNYLMTLFFKSIVLKWLGNYSEAKENFLFILENEPRIGREYSLPPQSALEIGLIEILMNNEKEAQKWLNDAINNYNHYIHENYVHVKAYAGLRAIGISNDKQNEDESKLKEYTKEWLKNLNIKEDKYESIIKEEESKVI